MSLKCPVSRVLLVSWSLTPCDDPVSVCVTAWSGCVGRVTRLGRVAPGCGTMMTCLRNMTPGCVVEVSLLEI